MFTNELIALLWASKLGKQIRYFLRQKGYMFLANYIEAMSFAIPLDARSSKVIPSSCQSLWRRANARNVSFLTLNGDQFTFSTLNYLSYSPTDAAPQFLEKLTPLYSSMVSIIVRLAQLPYSFVRNFGSSGFCNTSLTQTGHPKINVWWIS